MGIKIKDNRIIELIKFTRQAFGRYKLKIIILTLLGLLGGLLEGVGVNVLIPVFSFAMGEFKGGDDPISRAVEQFFTYINIDFSLKYLLIFICILLVFKTIVIIIISFVTISITSDYEAKTRVDLFKKTVSSSWPFLLKQKLGYLETVLMVDVTQSTKLLRIISGNIVRITSLLIYISIAMNISATITLITLIVGAVIFLALKPLMYITRMLAHKTANIKKEIAHFVNENILGLKTIKSMAVGDKIIKIGRERFLGIRKLIIKTGLIGSISSSLAQPVSLIFICIVFAISYRTPGFSLAALVVVIYLIQRITGQIMGIQHSLLNVNDIYPYFKSVLNYQNSTQESEEKDKGRDRFVFSGSLDFKNIYFSYNKKKKILFGVSFSINNGEMVGLIGPSGAGKTTIVDLVLRLFEPDAGKILLDGKDCRRINLIDWRKKIGYVSQDIFLINDTIANNIKFYDDSINDKDIMAVAKMANIDKFIRGCPKGLETIIGERGVLLSGGQRQRIIIARVLARKPELLILDEATSALDNESEVKIQKVIENLKGRITVFVIAHRLSTVINSDKLLVVENGKIIEQGVPAKLLNDKKSYFYKVYNIRE